jgi:superfamily II DNA/RNA helicase
MFIIDDADSILKLRHETKLMRMSASIKRNVFFSERLTGRIESLVDKMMVEPYLFEIEEGERRREKKKRNKIT